MVVDRDAKELAVVDRRRASRDRAKRRDLHARFDFDRRAPDLPAGFNVDGEGPLAVDHVHDAVVNGRRRQLTRIVHEARAPDRHEALDVGTVDLLERAVALPVVAHALGGDVFRVLAVVDEFVGRLGQSRPRPDSQDCSQQPDFLHDRPRLVAHSMVSATPASRVVSVGRAHGSRPRTWTTRASPRN